MSEPLRILMLEDEPADAQLVAERLRADGVECDLVAVRSLAEFRRALENGQHVDLVLADYRLRGGGGGDALHVRERLRPEVPFIFVSGTMHEEEAVESLRDGATDYVFKDRLSRLAPAVRRAIEEVGRRERTRRAEEERDRFYVLSPDMFCIVTLDGHMHDFNAAAWEHTLGWTREQLLSRPYMDFVHPEDVEITEREHRKLLEGGTVRRFENRYVRPDGQWVWLQWNAFLDPVQGLIHAAARDVTEAKVAQRALEVRAVQQAALAGLGQRALTTEDPRTTMEEAVELVVSTLGVQACGVLQQDPAAGGLVLRAGAGWPSGSVGRCLEEPQPFPEAARMPIRGGGRDLGFLVACTSSPHTFTEDDANFLQSVANLVAAALDRQRAAEALQRSEQQLRHSQKMEAVGQLAGGVAHDFNNLLTAIVGYSELISMRLRRGDPLHREVAEIRNAADRASSLTRQLLAFSRKQILAPRVLDLNTVVVQMENLVRRLIGETIELQTHLTPGLSAVRVDPGQIEQVVMNLAVNARDAMPSGGTLIIETADAELGPEYAASHPPVEAGQYVMLAVSDTGTGIDPETRARVFEPFFTTKEQGKGTGLGLSTVYGIVKQSGGYVWVYSEPGQGASFKIYLPVVHEEVHAPEPVPAAETPAGRGETILLVEDESAVRELAERVLRMHGWDVIAAADGADALARIRESHGPIHLLVSDVVMPGMSGRELAHRLSSEHGNVPVLFLSGYTSQVALRQGGIEPGVHFLQKPFTPDALARAVREALDHPIQDRQGAASGAS